MDLPAGSGESSRRRGEGGGLMVAQLLKNLPAMRETLV